MALEVTDVILNLYSRGADATAEDLERINNAIENVGNTMDKTKLSAGAPFEMAGFRMLSHEMLQHLGLGGQMRALHPLIHLGVRELDMGLLALGGTFATVTLGVAALAAGIIYLVEHMKKHKEAMVDVNSEVKKYLESIDEVKISHDKVTEGHLNQIKAIQTQIQAIQDANDGLRQRIEYEKEHSKNQKMLAADEEFLNQKIYAQGQNLQFLYKEREKLKALLKEDTEKEDKKKDFSAEIEDEKQKEKLILENTKTTYDQKIAAIDAAESNIKRIIFNETDEGVITTKKANAEMLKIHVESAKQREEVIKKEYEVWIKATEETSKLVAKAIGAAAFGSQNAWQQAGKAIVNSWIDAMEKKFLATQIETAAEAVLTGNFAYIGQLAIATAEMGGLEVARGWANQQIGGGGASSAAPSGGGGDVGTPAGGSPASTIPRESKGQSGGVQINATTIFNAGIAYLPDQSAFDTAMREWWRLSNIAMIAGQIPKVQYA